MAQEVPLGKPSGHSVPLKGTGPQRRSWNRTPKLRMRDGQLRLVETVANQRARVPSKEVQPNAAMWRCGPSGPMFHSARERGTLDFYVKSLNYSTVGN